MWYSWRLEEGTRFLELGLPVVVNDGVDAGQQTSPLQKQHVVLTMSHRASLFGFVCLLACLLSETGSQYRPEPPHPSILMVTANASASASVSAFASGFCRLFPPVSVPLFHNWDDRVGSRCLGWDYSLVKTKPGDTRAVRKCPSAGNEIAGVISRKWQVL